MGSRWKFPQHTLTPFGNVETYFDLGWYHCSHPPAGRRLQKERALSQDSNVLGIDQAQAQYEVHLEPGLNLAFLSRTVLGGAQLIQVSQLSRLSAFLHANNSPQTTKMNL